MLAGHTSDDFTHWIYVVREMVRFDDFGTNSSANCMFSSYPPGISVLQFFFIKLHMTVANGIFTEWRVFFAYHLLLASMLFPFLREEDCFGISILKIFILCTIPTLFYQTYSGLQPESLLGIMFGAGIGYIFLKKEKNFCYYLHIFLICFTLVLVKDSGLMLALFVASACVVDYYLRGSYKKQRRHVLVIGGIMLSGLIVPKIIWNWQIAKNQTEYAFCSGINLNKLADSFSDGQDSFAQTVVRNFLNAFVSNIPSVTSPWSYEPKINSNWFSLSFAAVFLVLLTLSFIILQAISRKECIDEVKESNIRFTLMWIFWSEIILYIVGICIIYITNFSESEAIGLASFNRYMQVPYLAATIVIAVCAYELISYSSQRMYIGLIGMLTCVVIIAPKSYALSYLSRNEVKESQDRRSKYTSLIYEIYNNCTMDDKVLFIDQEQWLYPYVTINYAVRPVQLDLIDGWPNWNITSDLIDHDSFVDQVMERDFVAIYHRDEYFIEEYSDLFSGQPEDVESFWLYKVDKSQKKLVVVE